ncbi:uncharacterized protein LOC123880321 isoform X2 [Maniola jurtina]|uniref:uncharacterized protein LOC123880321 isoform X2 n=1 Tax=Maniola jurtina TaxID=191418 RepID=UPI001E689CF7|nr:uncharacterized protein LOC123880321 isoform X2 [Maniola jurtina]
MDYTAEGWLSNHGRQRYGEVEKLSEENAALQARLGEKSQNMRDSESLPDINVEEGQEPEASQISGRRIVDIGFFFKKIQKIGNHGVLDCSVESLKLISEKRLNLNAKFTVKCLMCKEKSSISNVTGDLDTSTALGTQT